jgi:hypothetical protein
MIKVEGHSNLERDESSSAIVSTDYTGYLAVKKRRESFQNNRDDINTLKEEVGQMKNLITTLIEKLNGKDS